MNLTVEQSSKSYKIGRIYERELKEASVSKCSDDAKIQFIPISLTDSYFFSSTRWFSSLEKEAEVKF